MSKDFTDVAFSSIQLRKELDGFRDLLNSKTIVAEREIHNLFKSSPHLTAYVGNVPGISIGTSRQVAFEFEILGDYGADIVLGNRERRFCLVELEDASPDSVLTRFGKKSTKEWSKRFEHGFSQIVDWFCHLDDFRKTERFHRNFGYGHIDFAGLLLIGKSEGLDADDVRRLRWRREKITVDSHPVVCMTYDDLYRDLNDSYELCLAAFQVETNPPAT